MKKGAPILEFIKALLGLVLKAVLFCLYIVLKGLEIFSRFVSELIEKQFQK
jgi:hypothetical protein